MFSIKQDRVCPGDKTYRYAHSLLAKGINPLGTRQAFSLPRSINLTLVFYKYSQISADQTYGRNNLNTKNICLKTVYYDQTFDRV